MSQLTLLSSVLLIIFYFVDLYFKREYALIFVLTSNPYISGLIILLKIIHKLLPGFILNYKSLIFFLLTTSLILLIYYKSFIDLRTVVQFIQFSILFLIVIFSINSSNTNKNDVYMLIRGIALSGFLLSLIKIFDFIFFEGNFKINGLNEDTFLIVFSGLIGGMLFFKKSTAFSYIYFAIILFAIFLYESRSGLLISLSGYFLYLILITRRFKIIFLPILIITFIFFLDQIQILSSDLIDLNRNFSNLERFSMYLYAYEFLLSDIDPYGIGNVQNALDHMYRDGIITILYPHPHSTYLRLIFELKWLGFFVIFMFWYYLYIMLKDISINNVKAYSSFLIIIYTLILYALVESIFYSFYRGVLVLLIILLAKNKSSSLKQE